MTPDEVFDDIAAALAGRGVQAGAMFGKRALKADGKAFACLKGELLAFRLGEGTSAHREAHALPGAELFDPSGKGRPFKDWGSRSGRARRPVGCFGVHRVDQHTSLTAS